ncbi:MAG TPA: Ig-like domain-containing protein [Solirubrobacterales bacterium]|nr:Ig-like domain-containing protein [Solirubrobacterales bacterium]
MRFHPTIVQRLGAARRLVAVMALAGTLASIGLIAAAPASAAGPTVTINQAAGQSDPTSVSPVVFTAIFSAPVTGFTAADVLLSPSTAGGTLTAVVSGGSTTYTVSVSGMTTAGNVIASIPTGAAQDGSSNPSLASTSTDHTVTWAPDTTPPAVTINQAAGQADPSSASSVQFTATFSEPVTGFTASDVLLSSSTTGGTLTPLVTGGPSVYTVAVSGMAHAGNVVASIPAGAAIDAAGNSSLASSSTDNSVAWVLDTTSPAVTINQAPGQADPASVSPVQFTATFSEPVTGFTAADVLLSSSTAGGALATTVTGGPAVYTVGVSGMTGAGNVVASIRAGAAIDEATNPSLASGSTDNSVAWLPTVRLLKASNGEATKASLTLLSKCRPRRPCLTAKGGASLPLKVACKSSVSCAGILTITTKSPGNRAAQRPSKQKVSTLGRLRFAVGAGAKKLLRVPLTATARSLLAADPHVKASVTIALSSTKTKRTITFALPAPKRAP